MESLYPGEFGLFATLLAHSVFLCPGGENWIAPKACIQKRLFSDEIHSCPAV